MIEAMEQQIINGINNKWKKDKVKRQDIDIEKVSECFRVICSSRATTLAIMESIKESNSEYSKIQELKDNMIKIYDWITKETIESLIARYNTSLKDKKKEVEYKSEIPHIEAYLENLKEDMINKTMDKLFIFHKVTKGE
ncbi:hypothetical protein [Inconstantimicrobium mannanitabidum]|uniref:Uncharacterized protein n=1 Tax=Inconstantimicrobium mannanitabidum TaxID=1604901 RepID=A0ACB5RAF6_9CLOT|nr:hypothetical protein [Clostridium sp. TW13]GKX66020.1 hypothetical protein rsdtw13_12780 [Clostridium sp. TW13]